jgi:hypothetical protein
LETAILVSSRLDRADLTGAFVFGISASNLSLDGAVQKNLVIQRSKNDAPITLDDLEVAQFIYLLLNVPGGVFPDYELPDHTGTRQSLSELQRDDQLILTLARGHYCPKEHQQHLELAPSTRSKSSLNEHYRRP